jgi:hypothetical protein
MFVAMAWASSRSRITIEGLEIVTVEGLAMGQVKQWEALIVGHDRQSGAISELTTCLT